MDNIKEVSFSNSYTEHLYGFAQYDRGQKLKITGIETDANTEVHFSLSESGGESPRVLPDSTGTETIVSIPDFVFCADKMYDYEAYAFVYYSDVNVGKTERRIIMHVKARPKPADFAPPSEPDLTQKVLQELGTKLTAPSSAQIGQIFRVQSVTEDGNLVLEAVDMPSGGSGGGASKEEVKEAVGEYLKENPIEESDPTVPQWAKQQEKPKYTAEEVGALPVGTKIPSKTSDLQNDSGYLTEHQDLSDYALKEDLALKDSVDDNMELIASVEITEDVSVITVNKDADGNPFNIRSILVTGTVIGGADVTTNCEFVVKSLPDGFNFNAATLATFSNSLRMTAQNLTVYFRSRHIIFGGNELHIRENLSASSIGAVTLGATRYACAYETSKGKYITNFQLSTSKSFGVGTKFEIWGVRV